LTHSKQKFLKGMSVRNDYDMNFETGGNEYEINCILFHPSMLRVNVSMEIRTYHMQSMFPDLFAIDGNKKSVARPWSRHRHTIFVTYA